MTIHTLTKIYISKPVFDLTINSVNPKIFQQKYFMHCMSCSFCHDTCCHDPYGSVLVDLKNVEVIKNHELHLKHRVSTPVDSWFDPEIEPENNLPSKNGLWVNTREDHSCVFLNKEGRGCHIHSMCLDEKIDYHTVKPMYCWLFPLEVVDHVLGVGTHPKLEDESLICTGEGESLYRGVRDEVLYLFGEELIAELDVLEKIYESKSDNQVVSISKKSKITSMKVANL